MFGLKFQTARIALSASALCLLTMAQSAGAGGDTFVAGQGAHRSIPLFVDASHPWKSSNKTVATDAEAGGSLAQAEKLTVAANKDMDEGKYKEAEQIYWDVLKLRNQNPPQDSPDLAAAYHNLGAALECEKDAMMAENVYQRAIKIWEQGGKAQQKHLSEELQNLGEFYFSSKDYGKSIDALKRSLSVAEESNGKQNAALAPILDDLVVSLEQAGKGEEAGAYAKRAREISNFSKALPTR